MNLKLFRGTKAKSCSSPWFVDRGAQISEGTALGLFQCPAQQLKYVFVSIKLAYDPLNGF